MNIDDLITKIRNSELSISDIARKSLVSRKSIYNIINKKHCPSVELFNKILKIVEK